MDRMFGGCQRCWHIADAACLCCLQIAMVFAQHYHRSCNRHCCQSQRTNWYIPCTVKGLRSRPVSCDKLNSSVASQLCFEQKTRERDRKRKRESLRPFSHGWLSDL